MQILMMAEHKSGRVQNIKVLLITRIQLVKKLIAYGGLI